MNGGYTDWYIPAAGQLYEIYTNVTDINTALINIGGTALTADFYWSSSEGMYTFGANTGGAVSLENGALSNYGRSLGVLVRIVRDIE